MKSIWKITIRTFWNKAALITNNKIAIAAPVYKYYCFNDIDEPHIDLPYVHLPPQGLYDLINLQDQLHRMIFWILNPSVDYLNELSTNERIVLYNTIFEKQSGSRPVSFSTKISFSNNKKELNAIRYKHLNVLHKNPGNLDQEATEELKNVVERVRNTNVIGLIKTYKVKELADILFYQFYHMVLFEEKVKKCRNCGKYFVVRNLNVEYCSRPIIGSNDDKTCSDVGSKLAYQKKLKEDLPLQYYNRSYKTHYARINSGKMTKSEFYEWQQEAKDKLDAVRLGEYDFETYKVWLKK